MESNLRPSDVIGILLAAGESDRFGSNKLLYPLDHDEPMAVIAARNLIQVIPKCIAVTRPDDKHLATLLRREGFGIVVNPEPEDGIGSSINCAIRAAADASAWVIALADMPYIKPATIQQVVSCLEQGAMISAPLYRDRRGHPVGFNRALLSSLLSLGGDRGAQALIQQQASATALFQTEDEGVVVDIDRLADLPEIE